MRYSEISALVLLTLTYFTPLAGIVSQLVYQIGAPPFHGITECVKWKSSVIATHSAIIVLAGVLPILWVSRVDIRKLKAGFSHLVGSFFLLLLGWCLLIYGIPVANPDGAASFLGEVYCRSYFGSFVILVLSGASSAFATGYFYLMFKFYFFKITSGR